MPNNNQTIEYKQLLDNGEPFYPMVGKSSYSEWIGYEEVGGSGIQPDDQWIGFVDVGGATDVPPYIVPVANGGTGADNASDARSNLGIIDRTIKYGYYTFGLTMAANSGSNQTITYETLGIPANTTVLMFNVRQYHTGTTDDVYHSVFMGWSYDNTERKLWLRLYANRSSQAVLKIVVDYIYANGSFNAHG